MSIENKLEHLYDTRIAIKNAIIDKGVEVLPTDTFRSYASKIGDIQGGGSGDYVRVNFKDFVSGENYKNYNENYKIILPDGINTVSLTDPLIWEWNNIIYVGLGRTSSNSYGNNKIYKYNKHTLEYIGYFSWTTGFLPSNGNYYLYNGKVYLGTGNTYPTTSTTPTWNTNIRIIDLATETITNMATAMPTGTAYVTIFTKNWCYMIDNPAQATAATTTSYLWDLNTNTRYTFNTNTYGAKAIDYQGDYVFVAGGGNTGVATVQKIDLTLRTLTTLTAMPRVNNNMKMISNENYFWVYGGWQTGGTSKELIQYRISDGERTIINLDFSLDDPMERQYQYNPYRFKDNLYLRGIHTTMSTNFLLIDTTDDDWYINQKGLSYMPFIFGKISTQNGIGIVSNYFINDDNIIYSGMLGSGVSYQNQAYGVFAMMDGNKYITLNTPIGTIVRVGTEPEFEVSNTITILRSPFTGYVKYK